MAQDPETDEEWRRAVIGAVACLGLNKARSEDGFPDGPVVPDSERCRDIITRGILRGIDLAEIMPEVEEFVRMFSRELLATHSAERN